MAKSSTIWNHAAPGLSELDLAMVRSVPPGGNWKDIPLSIPSKRLDQIRQSYAEGKGSRSTYYGRLKADAPSYTINTYYNRPGNGCHIHYDFAGGQHRVLSHREAARLQSFPDHFMFEGTQGAILKQIGNAVPPLLAYQIAAALPESGAAVDLFAGAGGLSLGFHWAGWRVPLAIDIERHYLATNSRNLGSKGLALDLANAEHLKIAIGEVKSALDSSKGPRLLLGGPPCQGFSTAGKKRSMTDARNHLFKAYARLINAVSPDHFLFENVPGLRSMEGGRVLAMVRKTFEELGYSVQIWDLMAHHFGVPQRRRRLFLIGSRHGNWPIPTRVLDDGSQLFRNETNSFVTVCEAISDLPPLNPGEDGSSYPYASGPKSSYQKLMRGQMTPARYLSDLRSFSTC